MPLNLDFFNFKLGFRPAGRVTFFTRVKKVTKETRP